MPQLIVLGEALIDVFADAGIPLRAAKTLHPRPGGAPANVAVALARLGADVGFIGKVGVDDYGAFLIDLLTQEGVDTTYFVADPRAPTMMAVVAVPSPTEQHFILYSGASVLLAPDDIPQSTIAAATAFLYSSVTLAGDGRAAALQAVEWARAGGNHVIFDVNLRPAVWPNLELARRYIAESVTSATILKLNESELAFLTDTDDPAAGSEQLLAYGPHLCCVSLGAGGAYFNNGLARGHVPAFAIDVVDTTGSGDAFVAGLAYQLHKLSQPVAALDEETLRGMVTFANACGGLAATQQGAMSALPTREAVDALVG